MPAYTRVVVLLIVLSFTPVFSYAGDEESDPIDQKLEECIKKNFSTAGMNSCSNAAYEEWDKLLNDVYKKLLSKLAKDAREALKNSQREWIKYRDAEFRFVNAYYDGFQGSVWTNLNHGDHVNLIRARALKLKSYLELMDMK
jgi:uncharacterized protein YecT (DUF1311 family)